jgi:hypothetical protein
MTGPPRVVVVEETCVGGTVVGGAPVVAGEPLLGGDVETVEGDDATVVGDAATVVGDVVRGVTTVLDEAVLDGPAVVVDGSPLSAEQAAANIMTRTIPRRRRGRALREEM